MTLIRPISLYWELHTENIHKLKTGKSLGKIISSSNKESLKSELNIWLFPNPEEIQKTKAVL